MRRDVDLGGSDWLLGQVAQQPFGDVDDIADVREWLPARVPGDVRLDLLAAGRIPDPYFGKQNEESKWVDASDWWFRRDVELELSDEERAFLIFDGIDYQSSVFWNGALLGKHIGMFSRQTFELPHPKGGRSTLGVRVWGSEALPKMSLNLKDRLWQRILTPFFPVSNEPLPDRFATLKCQMSFGWDFAPRLRTCGIWDDVRLVIVPSVFIRDVHVTTQNVDADSARATVQADVELDSRLARDARLVILARQRDTTRAQEFAFDWDVTAGNQKRRFSFILRDAALWNPWDRGTPHLYDLEFRIEERPGRDALDIERVSFGVRTIELAIPDGSRTKEPWTVIINGEREFIRGVNWVPLDAMPGRLTCADYAGRVRQAREGNANFLRVWGGGLREKRAFYDVCDEKGMLVWQEFPFSGAILDRFPTNNAHLAFAQRECADIVRQLRNHPSVVVWCGGNEFNTRGNRKIVDMLREVVAEGDPSRPFKPASPYQDESHYWEVWHRMANLRDYQKTATPFLSEFGMQSPPSVESLKRFLPQDKLYPPNEMWEYHRAELTKLLRYAIVMDPTPGTLEQLVSASQKAQALGLQIAIEHMRRRKGWTSGVAVWQLNDPWPAISWSVVDYYGLPKSGYWKMKELYSPVLVSLDYPLKRYKTGDRVSGGLWIINDLKREFSDVELDVWMGSQSIYRRKFNVPPDSAQRVDALEFEFGEDKTDLVVQLKAGQEILDRHLYDLNWADEKEVDLMVAMVYAVINRLMR